ncbi:MAG: hypothetical protein V7641_4680, partial [Blastocatellia bacterium]
DEIAHELFAQVFDVEPRCAGRHGFLFKPAKLFSLADIGGKADHLAAVGFFEPAQDD